MEPREKLPKVKLDAKNHERGNKILNLYLPNADTIPETTHIVHAMGIAVAYTMEVKSKEKSHRGARKAEGRKKREHKLKAEMKRLRQDIARAGNKLHKQKQQRKATKKKKEITNQLRISMNGNEMTSRNLKAAKEQRL